MYEWYLAVFITMAVFTRRETRWSLITVVNYMVCDPRAQSASQTEHIATGAYQGQSEQPTVPQHAVIVGRQRTHTPHGNPPFTHLHVIVLLPLINRKLTRFLHQLYYSIIVLFYLKFKRLLSHNIFGWNNFDLGHQTSYLLGI